MTDEPTSSTLGLLGPGAIGSSVAAALMVSGHEVQLFGRRRFERLVIEGDVAPGTHEVDFCDSPETVANPVDVLFVALKAHQVASAADWLAALVGDKTIVVACLNGVEHEAVLRPFVGEATVVPVVVMLPAHAVEPGKLVMRSPGALILPNTPEAQIAADLFDADFLEVKTADDFAQRSWRKLMGNAVSGGIAALARQSIDVADDPDARELVVGLYREVIAVAAAAGVTLDPELAEKMADNYTKKSAGHLPSIAVDRINGRPTEWRYRNEVVVRLAESHGVDVPLNRIITTLLRLGEP